MSLDLESFWDQILSRQTELIVAAYQTLSPSEQNTVLAHLRRMASEPDWLPEQSQSAQTALKVLLPFLNQ